MPIPMLIPEIIIVTTSRGIFMYAMNPKLIKIVTESGIRQRNAMIADREMAKRQATLLQPKR